MYRVWFTFRNELGEDVRDYLDNNGEGFRNYDAVGIARELQARGHEYVKICRIGSLADIEEQKGV